MLFERLEVSFISASFHFPRQSGKNNKRRKKMKEKRKKLEKENLFLQVVTVDTTREQNY